MKRKRKSTKPPVMHVTARDNGGATIRDSIAGYLNMATEPLTVQELATRMLDGGWRTSSANPKGMIGVEIQKVPSIKRTRKGGRWAYSMPPTNGQPPLLPLLDARGPRLNRLKRLKALRRKATRGVEVVTVSRPTVIVDAVRDAVQARLNQLDDERASLLSFLNRR